MRVLRRLRARVGRRGLTLLSLGLAFFLIGLKGYFSPSEDLGRFILYTFLPDWARGLLWGIPAALAFVAAVRRGGRDGVGFAALVVPPVVLSVSYLWSGVAFLLGATNYAFGWTQAAIWLSILSFVLIVSGWPEAPATEGPSREP